jgi:DNA helicase HerA-like ATPase
MAFLLTFLYEHRQAQDLGVREAGTPSAGQPDLRHLLIVEEAHRLLGNAAAAGRNRGEAVGEDAAARAVGLFVDMLAEIRAYGQGLMIVEQIPTKLVSEAVKNTNLKVMLRLTAEDAREFLGTAMGFTDEQKRFVNGLRTGQCAVFEELLDRPVMLTIPHPEEWPSLFSR